ncbi:MAG TPA: ABC transporter substrate-binding protein, partial [Tepidisphaeraceae bacterium]
MLRILIIPLALVGLLLAAMVWSGGGVEKRADFAFLNRGDVYTLDLNKMSYLQDFRMTYGIREGLYSPDPVTLRPIPAGATGYDLSDDKRVWTFHLREECKWSNGDPVTARDYVFSWRRMLEEPGEYTYLYDYVRNAKAYVQSYARGEPIDFKTVGIQALDDRTFRVTLVNPVPYLLELAAFPPFYPRHERSMTKYRVFVDTDVMDAFDRWAASNKKSFDFRRATQNELLDALTEFAATDPLKGAAAEKKDSKALGVGS